MANSGDGVRARTVAYREFVMGFERADSTARWVAFVLEHVCKNTLRSLSLSLGRLAQPNRPKIPLSHLPNCSRHRPSSNPLLLLLLRRHLPF